jgi:hypothetical protein
MKCWGEGRDYDEDSEKCRRTCCDGGCEPGPEPTVGLRCLDGVPVHAATAPAPTAAPSPAMAAQPSPSTSLPAPTPWLADQTSCDRGNAAACLRAANAINDNHARGRLLVRGCQLEDPGSCKAAIVACAKGGTEACAASAVVANTSEATECRLKRASQACKFAAMRADRLGFDSIAGGFALTSCQAGDTAVCDWLDLMCRIGRNCNFAEQAHRKKK